MKYLTQLGPEHAWSWVVGVYSHTLWAFRRTGSNQESETVDWWFAVLVWVVNSAQWHESSRGMTGMRRWYLPCWQYSALVLLCSDSGISPTVTLVYLDSHDSYQTQQKKKRNVFMCFSIMWPPSHHWHQIWHPSSKRWDIWIWISGQFSCSGGQSCLCDTSMICLTRAIRVNDLTIYIFHRQTVKKHCLTAAGPTGLTRKEKKGGQQAARRRVQRRQCCVTIRKQDIRGKKPAEEEEHRDYTHGERLQELLCFAFFFW